jgi:hypothetical protein
MLEANPNLSPNAIKAILQYTAQVDETQDFLTQGAGYLNARGAIRLARFWAHPEGGLGEMSDRIFGETIPWGRHLIWGNYRLSGGVPLPGVNAWASGLVWGASTSLSGGRVVWGAESLDNIVWSMLDDNIVWGYSTGDNIVWSMNDNIVWSMADNIVWSMDDNIVWSMVDDNIVWSMSEADNIVWSMDCGGGNCANIVWGQRAPDGTLWGAVSETDNIVWSMADDNIVWSMGDNIVWSMLTDNIVWSMSTVKPTLWPRSRSSQGR